MGGRRSRAHVTVPLSHCERTTGQSMRGDKTPFIATEHDISGSFLAARSAWRWSDTCIILDLS